MKPKYFYLILFLSVAGFLTFNAFSTNDGISTKGNGNDKIIKFSHKIHADATDCQSCHSKASQSAKLGNELFPKHADCQQCHDTEDKTACNFCHYDNVYKKLENVNSNLIFNHSSHVTVKKLPCTECHKGLNEVDYGFRAPQAYPPMEYCYSACHSNSKGIATNECSGCHVSTAGLIPVSHQTADFKRTHKFDAQKTGANCIMCHDNTSCQDCHVGTTMLNEKNTATDFYAPYTPAQSLTNGAKQQQITKVHDLNYVYNHAIDAKDKSIECRTCHNIETFCVDCHNSRQSDFSISGVMPSSHKQNGFIIPGVGGGGGLHATLAKRDIESCQSCHDTQNGDVNCIQCHTDSDGIKGTNPKTHPANYMHDVHGDWHTTQSSLCYNCHITASPNSPSGIGFCGYCHGQQR